MTTSSCYEPLCTFFSSRSVDNSHSVLSPINPRTHVQGATMVISQERVLVRESDRRRTVRSVMLDNTLYDKRLFNISETHPIITEVIKDYSPI